MSTSEAAGAGMGDANALAEAERSGWPFLVLTDGEHRQRLFLFRDESDSASVGRLASSDLVIDWDTQVSRLHARFERLDDAWTLIDDGLSSNGTFVNGERLNGKRRLSDGDVVRFGATTAVFRSARPGRAPSGDAADLAPAVALSSTQRRVLEALCLPCRTGGAPATDQQIADELVVSVAEVRGHLRVLYAKFGVAEPSADLARAQLVQQAFAMGLVAGGG